MKNGKTWMLSFVVRYQHLTNSVLRMTILSHKASRNRWVCQRLVTISRDSVAQLYTIAYFIRVNCVNCYRWKADVQRKFDVCFRCALFSAWTKSRVKQEVTGTQTLIFILSFSMSTLCTTANLLFVFLQLFGIEGRVVDWGSGELESRYC